MKSRRQVLAMIGRTAGASALYHAMSAWGFAAPSTYRAPPQLEGAPPGTRVIVLGAGIAGLIAAYELGRAGYQVQVLEFNTRAGGRSWTLRGGDRYTELGGAVQECRFEQGLYLNPGPWRLPFHHTGMIDYASRLNVALEPFTQLNYNAYIHRTTAYSGVPQRFRHVMTDYQGHISELLARSVRAGELDQAVTHEDADRLLDSLRRWGALDADYRYVAGPTSSGRRGWQVLAGGGLMPPPEPSQPLDINTILQSGLWRELTFANEFEHHPTMLQPVGGMDRIAQALYARVSRHVQLGAHVTAIDQDQRGVRITYSDARHHGESRQAHADWCVCTIPLSILSQIEIRVGAPMQAAIDALPYEASVKVGLQFGRRFWEEDERIYGGITYTNLPIQQIAYPSSELGKAGPGILLGAYVWGPNAFEFTSMSPAERIEATVRQGSQIHPQYTREFEHGMAVAWHRVPGAMGCFAAWSDAAREAHYENLCQIDGRIVLAGEHASRLPAWQEGALLSSLDAIERLHQRILATR